MKKRSWFLQSCVVFGLLVTVGQAHAEDEEERVLEVGKWYPTLEGGINLTQSAYSDNWNGGDKGSIVWTAIVNGSLENQLSPKVNSASTLKLAYGQTHQQKQTTDGNRFWDRPEKSTDLIDLESVLRLTLGLVVDPFFSARFESQFQDASDPNGRTLSLNPMKFQETAGIARKFIDEEDRQLLSRVGFSFRQHLRKQFVESPTSAPNPPATDTATNTEFTNDGGLEFVTEYSTKVLQDRVTWNSKFRLFQTIFYSAQNDFDSVTADQWRALGVDPDVVDFNKAPDVDFENIFTTQITKIISVNLYLRWLYDKYDNSVVPTFNDDGELKNVGDIRTATRLGGQFKQTLSIGLTYRFL
ncbi:MAG: DUF3078 domain-containing protein [Candidatus Eisenbacteria bacterium]|uniref:DUF3078 domain-containing protein n=1 Tax=Eiseniibacteriota bacterium TaxID=2212470 RepID=A0A956LVN4_UNCEI|nr:DUF3078 domain-containing protein [Candidatus Eisenbacteria bacterium]